MFLQIEHSANANHLLHYTQSAIGQALMLFLAVLCVPWMPKVPHVPLKKRFSGLCYMFCHVLLDFIPL